MIVTRLIQYTDENFDWRPQILMDAVDQQFISTAKLYCQVRPAGRPGLSPQPAPVLSFGPTGAPAPYRAKGEGSGPPVATASATTPGAFVYTLSFGAPAAANPPPGMYVFDVLYVNTNAGAPQPRRVVARGSIEVRQGCSNV